ncbi:MAG: YggS family pyridoxal phosphate-dependent enzyme [Eubacteriales bacterium]|nr:YggS family pyridoxal phosphate-dependent enzyme [Eubacteriales bacterium]
MNRIEENIGRIRAVIEQAAAVAGHTSRDITLVAVSKFVDAQRIGQAVDAGQLDFGENRAQELRDKQPLFPQCRWHFVGQLQTNKVKYVVGNACLIQSVDRPALLQSIQRLAQRQGIVQDVLIEVNIAGEAAKAGVPPDGLLDLLYRCRDCPNVRARGLMVVPPAGPVESSRRWFIAAREHYEKAREQGFSLHILSMGMSQDYDVAIEEGATMVRVGSSIFGPRQAR